MTEERAKYIKNHGKWFDIRAEGQGTICIKAVTTMEAIREAAKRWGIEADEIRNFSVKELEN